MKNIFAKMQERELGGRFVPHLALASGIVRKHKPYHQTGFIVLNWSLDALASLGAAIKGFEASKEMARKAKPVEA